MKNTEEVQKWLIKANNDYKTAERLLNDPPNEIITDTVCFHCQQFVEKVLKAFLVSKDADFAKTHDLRYLVKLCSDLDTSFGQLNEAVKVFSTYAVEIRYTDEFYTPSVDEAKECFGIAKKFKDFVFGKLGVTDDIK